MATNAYLEELRAGLDRAAQIHFLVQVMPATGEQLLYVDYLHNEDAWKWMQRRLRPRFAQMRWESAASHTVRAVLAMRMAANRRQLPFLPDGAVQRIFDFAVPVGRDVTNYEWNKILCAGDCGLLPAEVGGSLDEVQRQQRQQRRRPRRDSLSSEADSDTDSDSDGYDGEEEGDEELSSDSLPPPGQPLPAARRQQQQQGPTHRPLLLMAASTGLRTIHIRAAGPLRPFCARAPPVASVQWRGLRLFGLSTKTRVVGGGRELARVRLSRNKRDWRRGRAAGVIALEGGRSVRAVVPVWHEQRGVFVLPAASRRCRFASRDNAVYVDDGPSGSVAYECGLFANNVFSLTAAAPMGVAVAFGAAITSGLLDSVVRG